LADMAPPTMTAILSNMVEDDRQGLLQGVIAALGAIAAVVAPILMTGLFQTFASAQVPLYLPGAPFLLSGLLVLVALPLFWRLKPARG
ncbi:MAG: tetracycline resistance MFS efflux pump, partial [Rhodobacterales bacterium]